MHFFELLCRANNSEFLYKALNSIESTSIIKMKAIQLADSQNITANDETTESNHVITESNM